SPSAPMVLRGKPRGRAGHRRNIISRAATRSGLAALIFLRTFRRSVTVAEGDSAAEGGSAPRRGSAGYDSAGQDRGRPGGDGNRGSGFGRSNASGRAGAGRSSAR